MRLRLAPGEDEQAVAWSVVATLRERFGISLDPDSIRPRSSSSVLPEGDPRPGSANELADTRERLRLAAAQALDGIADLDGSVDLDDLAGVDEVLDLIDADEVVDLAHLLGDAGSMAAGSALADAGAMEPETDLRFRTVIPRAAIRDLQVHRDARSVQVMVALGHGDRVEEGRATSVPTSHGTLRAVAEATVASLRELTDGPLLVGIDRVSATHGEDAPVATVVLSLLTHRGEERLLGASIIHDCPERAVLRATLDALNRRVMPLLLDRDADPTGSAR